MRLSLVVSLALATAAFAAEQAAPSTSAAPDESLAAARREFEAMKRLREGLPEQKGSLPQISAPALDVRMPGPAIRSSSSKEKEKMEKAEKKSANWLVEAMNKEKKESQKEGARSREEVTRRDSTFPLEAVEKTGEETALANQAAKQPEQAPERKAPPHNPLNQYLADWMTPGDYALLKPSANADVNGAMVRGGLGSGPMESTLAVSAATETMAALGRDKPAFTPPPKENPYLQVLALPPPPPAVLAPVNGPSMPGPTQPASAAFSTSVSPMPAPAKVPEFVRPLPDEKHFKQLKRF